MTKVLILGSTGMLGSMVKDYLSKQPDLQLTTPARELVTSVVFSNFDYIINCIGIIKPKLKDSEEAIIVNSAFPYSLSRLAPKAKIIQIATDCVFEGDIGNYNELAKHDANDIYGKTKSLGEVNAPNFYNIRCSIIGFDKQNLSLLSWFLSQKGIVKGFDNHWWNGITTLHFAKLCYAIINENLELPNLIHFIPKDTVNKYELLKIIKKAFKSNIRIHKVNSPYLDRVLDTNYPEKNKALWFLMGYLNPPTIEQMVEELAEYVKT